MVVIIISCQKRKTEDNGTGSGCLFAFPPKPKGFEWTKSSNAALIHYKTVPSIIVFYKFYAKLNFHLA